MNLENEGSGLPTSRWWNGATNAGSDDGVWFWEGTSEVVDMEMPGGWDGEEPMEGEGNCAVMEGDNFYLWEAADCATFTASVICQIDGPL